PGGSITEALVVGRYEDGEPEQFWLPFDEETKRNATHILVAGIDPDKEIAKPEAKWTFAQAEPVKDDKSKEEALAELMTMLV
ncbi:hypothetical protein KBZ21_41210, partial [Streptomyces sp. A73]|nr:hypothetical protein [Streptomyces sp. A73]